MDTGESPMLNIVCLKWGEKYGAEYVNRLYAGVRRNTTHDFRFWCFTEHAQGICPEITVLDLPMRYGLHTWWNKIWLFSPANGLPSDQQVLYIDLDTLIVSNIDDIMQVDQVPDIVLLRDFYQGIARTAGDIGSGIMSWRQGQYTDIWHEFIQDPEAAIGSVHPHGDQAWIAQHVRSWYHWQDLFPDRVVSFKVHCAQGLPPTAGVVCYHGRPTIPESVTMSTDHGTAFKKWHVEAAPWVLDHWRD
jgi:hypothetical protein